MSRGLRSYGRRRNLLHFAHLEPFKAWIVKRGWFEVPVDSGNSYEVLRLRRHSDHLKNGEPSLTIVYRRESRGPGRARHLTVQSALVPFVEQFLEERKRSDGDT